jgi:hypothetical protein
MAKQNSKILYYEKIVVLIMAIFLIFSMNSFSQDKSHKTGQSIKTEQPKKGYTKKGHKPKKSGSKKIVHKSKPKRSGKKSTGNQIKL